ncbi:MAG TPA: cyclic nucleotide-binding domain-containing protein [Actinomycetota bacterium]|nr:cyclic nucleotide-binding domain-containing protein [Actinomycetota bacterium]
MASSTDTVELLSSLALFADLSRPQLEVVAHSFEEEFFPEGQRVLRQGIAGSNFYVIVDGEASVRIDGVDRVTLARGDFFGEISVLLNEPPNADIVALRPLRCIALPGTALVDFLVDHPRVMYRMLQTEALRLRATALWQM